MRALNGWLTILWIVMIPTSYALGWLRSVTYVSALSYPATGRPGRPPGVEVSQQKQIEKEKEHPVEERVVEKIIEETDVDTS